MEFTEINITYKNRLVKEIIKKLKEKIGFNEFASQKIETNLNIMATKLLGKSIRTDRDEIFIDMCVEKFISALPSRGEPVGILAGQSLTQPITQAVLKSQHSAGKEKSTSDTSLIALNKMQFPVRKISIHYKENLSLEQILSKIKQIEHISLDELLRTSFGKTKYRPIEFKPAKNDLKIYIGVSMTSRPSKSLLFTLDKDKLKTTGLTHLDIFEAILTIENIGLIIHPVSTFKFELVPNKIGYAEFLEKIEDLRKLKISGIIGVQRIETKSLKASDFIRYKYYDSETDKTILYLNPELIPFFPIEQLKRRIIGRYEENHMFKNPAISDAMYLTYDGPVKYSSEEYHYVNIIGMMSMEDIVNSLGSELDENYTLSNDPNELIPFLGTQNARSIYELSYHNEIKAVGYDLSYSHIMVLCSRLFRGNGKNPITPSGYNAISGINPIDKFAFQNYKNNLCTEIRTSKKYEVRGLITSVILGATPKEGTNYILTTVNVSAKKKMLEMYSDARKEQQFSGKYKGVNLYAIGTLSVVTKSLQTSIKFSNAISGL